MMWCDKILRALVHLATTNSSRFFAIATTRALGLQVLATWRIVNRFMDTLSRTWNSFSCMFSPRGVKELTKRNFKEMLTKWYVRRAMLCQKKKKTLSSFSYNWIFSASLLCWTFSDSTGTRLDRPEVLFLL